MGGVFKFYRKKQGKFLITWPWKFVAFLPLLITEITESYEDSKIVVISNRTGEKNQKNFFGVPTLLECIDYLLYSEDDMDREIDINIKKEFSKKKLQRIVFKKQRVTRSVIRNLKYPGVSLNDDHLLSPRKCKEKLKKEITELDIEPEILNQDGFFTLTLIEEEKIPHKLNYQTLILPKILFFIEKFRRVNKFLKPKEILKKTEIQNIANSNCFIINSSLEMEDLVEIIEKIEPDILVLEDLDYVMHNLLFKHSSNLVLFERLSKLPVSLQIYFSTGMDVRRFYMIHKNHD